MLTQLYRLLSVGVCLLLSCSLANAYDSRAIPTSTSISSGTINAHGQMYPPESGKKVIEISLNSS
jgi:hypothetical protein